MYIDETGNADLKNVENQNQRFLSLTGVIISLPMLRQRYIRKWKL